MKDKNVTISGDYEQTIVRGSNSLHNEDVIKKLIELLQETSINERPVFEIFSEQSVALWLDRLKQASEQSGIIVIRYITNEEIEPIQNFIKVSYLEKFDFSVIYEIITK